ncbi:hypothetical protein EVAR_90134_1 [Eumeta japonica]|uniref:Uncharacterized protein n=1 Tax=Eumeta variegata TaxID=151549 RepID=A0A4C2A0Q2_EUMVA|nr:hypothetical protein EVAR_90134_1 [Eumeta japonica]
MQLICAGGCTVYKLKQNWCIRHDGHPLGGEERRGQWSRNSSRTVPAKSDRGELPRDVGELIRAKNTVLHRVGKYRTCENRSHGRALQRKEKARMKEVRNENWSDLVVEISPSHKPHWGLVKALKMEGAVPTPVLKRPDKSIAFDDREKAECLGDSIEHQRLDNPPHDLDHISRVEEEVHHRVSIPPKDDLDPITHDEVGKHIKGLKIRKAPALRIPVDVDHKKNRRLQCRAIIDECGAVHSFLRITTSQYLRGLALTR